jgi:hypothetical protein
LLHGVAVDPSDPNVVYVAADVGVFKGTLSGGTASWEPFDDGLPSGIDVRDIETDRVSKTLTIGTYAAGAFRRDVAPGAVCAAHALLVRDNALDRGAEPSPSGVPDPEHPIPDPAHVGFYKPDDTPAGKAYWWTSTDIRIDVPSADAPKNQIADADHVEFETCPVLIADCPPGTMVDRAPQRGKSARAYVQVSNAGNQPLSNVRVIALWTDATAAVPLLPADFWSVTFPAGTTSCGPLSAGPWQLVDPAEPCRVIPTVGAVVPEIARFDWNVPMSAAEHSCMLVVVDSADDPIKSSIRAANERAVWVLVPQNRQIAQRNLHVIDPPKPAAPPPMPAPMLLPILIPNPTNDAGIDIELAQTAGAVRIVLPKDVGQQRLPRAALTDAERRQAAEAKIDAAAVYEVPRSGTLRLPIAPGEVWRVAIIAPARGPARIDVLARQGARILGGSSYVIRP